MFGFLRKGRVSEEERLDVIEYLREVRPLMHALNQEYQTWLAAATTDTRTLAIECDPDGQNAASYLWRVGHGQPPPYEDPAVRFVQGTPPKAARRYHDAFSLCLEARAAAADAFKHAAERVGLQDPAGPIGEANRRLAESEKELARANTALRELEDLVSRH